MTPRRKPRWPVRVLRTLVLIYAVYLLFGLVAQRRLMYPRHLLAPPEARADHWFAAHRVERWWVEHDQGRTEAWFMPAANASAQSPAPAVVFAHGNAEVIDDWPFILENYRDSGVSVLLVEFRGYGRSDGSPSQAHMTHDFAAALDRMLERDDVDGDRLIYHGRSLGGGVACALIAHRRPAAVVLQSSLASTGSIAWRFGFPGPLIRDAYRNAEVLRGYDGPVLILHGLNDQIIPASHGRRLHAAAPHSTLIKFEHGHNDFPLDANEFWQPIRQLIAEL